MNVHLIILIGQGDTEIKIVDEETFTWIKSPPDQPTSDDPRYINKCTWIDSQMPQSQKDKLRAIDGNENVIITSGSWENDRALQACNANGYEDIWPDSVGHAVKIIGWRDDSLQEESYEGCIY